MSTAPPPRRARPGRRRALRFVHTLHSQLTRQFLQEPPDGLRPLGGDDRIAVASVHVSRVVVLARRDDFADPGRRPAAVAAGAAHLFGFAAVALILRRGRGQGRGRNHRHHRAHRGLRRRARTDQGKARRPGPARRPDAARAAGPHPGPGQAARTRRGSGGRPWCSSRPAAPRSAATSWMSFSDGKMLEVALVDVSGKGNRRGDQGAAASPARSAACSARCPGTSSSPACNAYMRRGKTSEGFVTARAPVARPGHGGVRGGLSRAPAGVHYDGASGRWRLTRARGIVSA